MFPLDIRGTVTAPRKPGVSETEAVQSLMEELASRLREAGAHVVVAQGESVGFTSAPFSWASLSPLLRHISRGDISLKVQGNDVVVRYRLRAPFILAPAIVAASVALFVWLGRGEFQVRPAFLVTCAAIGLGLVAFRYFWTSTRFRLLVAACIAAPSLNDHLRP